MKRFTLIVLFVMSVLAVSAQSEHYLNGTLRDQNGAVVIGAKITLRGTLSQVVVTNTDGYFAFGNIPSGDYELKISANGFAEQSQKIKVRALQTTLNLTLAINTSEFTVTAEIGNNVERKNIPQAINLISSDQLLERANPIAQVAQEEAGINVQRTSPTMGGISIRGLVGTKVNVYVDGVRYTTSAQRGGVSTFFNLNEPSDLQSVEILRGSSSAQYGSDALGGTVSLLTKNSAFGETQAEFHGEINTNFNYADQSFGGSTNFSYGTNNFGGSVNLAGRKIGELRTANGLDSHAAVTRFLGLPSNVLGDRLRDTAFQQYGGSFRLNYSPTNESQLVFNYSRSQQDDGKRYDQLLGGDGNLIADLRNLMLDFGYLRFVKQNLGWFDAASFTLSYNSQREERVNQGGQGDPFGTITHQYERTRATGFSGFLDKNFSRNSFLVGGDIYGEKINSPAYTLNPRTNTVTLSRPRIPDASRYISAGIFIQDIWQAIPERLRMSGALRYSISDYKVRAADSPVVNNFRLWNDDNLQFKDFSGRIGAVVRIAGGARVAVNYSRGFRAPSITDLGTLGLTGDGFEIDFTAANNLGGTIGSTADASAMATGLPVGQQRSEVTDNYDFSFRFGSKRFETEATVFVIDFRDSITKQTLILPSGAVGKPLGDQIITSQNANGAVFVPLSTAPVLVRTNYAAAKIYGFEYEAEARLTKEIKFTGNYTYIHAEDQATGLPPNIEGGTPPPTGFVSLKYEPAGKPFWVELYSTLTSRQDRLSSLDLSDRRTGGTRSRTQIQNFFRRGACVRGIIGNPDGICGTGDETTLLATGETVLQVENRILGVGVNSAPLFTNLPGYATVNLRGGFRLKETSTITWAFENILDQQYRNPSWGIDGAGRSFRVGYRLRF